jgi:cytochrome oxidase assembly protein ShyY1
MSRPGHRFRPSLAATLAVLLGVPILCALGFWQISRGQEKARLLTQATAYDGMPAIELNALTASDVVEERRPVRAHGVFLGESQGLLDNQVRDGTVGYDVLTPLQLSGSGAVVLVDRGWLGRGPRRADVPQWRTPDGEVSVTGYLRVPTDVPLVDGRVAETLGGFWVVSEIDPQRLGEYLGMALQPRILRLAPESAHGFRRDWPVVTMSPQRHYGYAVQWFGLAAALLVLYIIAGRRRARGLEK